MFACVCIILLLCHLQNYTQEKNLLSWIHQLMIFTLVFTLQKYKNQHFISQVYTSQGHITMATHVVKHSNVVENFKMFCVFMIMQRESQPVLHTKFNLNTILEIYMCLLKALHCSNLVQHHSQKWLQHQNHPHFMLCVHSFLSYDKKQDFSKLICTSNKSPNC